MGCDGFDVGDARAWRCHFLVYTSFIFFCPFSGFGLEHTLWISLFVVFPCFLCGIAYVGASFGFHFDAVRY